MRRSDLHPGRECERFSPRCVCRGRTGCEPLSRLLHVPLLALRVERRAVSVLHHAVHRRFPLHPRSAERHRAPRVLRRRGEGDPAPVPRQHVLLQGLLSPEAGGGDRHCRPHSGAVLEEADRGEGGAGAVQRVSHREGESVGGGGEDVSSTDVGGNVRMSGGDDGQRPLRQPAVLRGL